MTLCRKTVSILLVAIAIGAPLPFFPLGDVNKDLRLDLTDVMMGIRDLVELANQGPGFESAAKKTIVALRAAAGIDTVISAQDSASHLNPDSQGPLWMVNAAPQIPVPVNVRPLQLINTSLLSTETQPPTPPPRIV